MSISPAIAPVTLLTRRRLANARLRNSHTTGARRHARLTHGRNARRRDRALDKPAAEHACLSLARVIKHAGLARRHAVLAVEKINLHAAGSAAQPGRLRRPGGAHLDEH